jgi:membrane protease YdiL (CAAX protease family)
MFTLHDPAGTAMAGSKPQGNPMIEIRELVAALLFVHLTANAGLIARVVGPVWLALSFAVYALLIYCGAVSGRQFTARLAIGWVGAPWRAWMGAAAVGCMLGLMVKAAIVMSGHSTHVTESFHKQILAVTLGPIVEEICLRGILVSILARLVGPTGAVFVGGGAFALLHLPGSLLKLASIAITGITYGWIRIRSGSTALAAVAHSTYNLTVLILGALR